ncbi:hypothetical protein F5Y19DRAFT_471500 [Xylariaceae sp. FL1651]|nr:hypothetical protein F5Y19DRAFT_471500 [Xylariaceae sp. FL1651]
MAKFQFFEMLSSAWNSLLDAINTARQRNASQRLVVEDAFEKARGVQGQLDDTLGVEKITSCQLSQLTSKLSLLSSWPLLLLSNILLTIIIIIITWKLASTPPTNLEEDVLTTDGKHFPRGQLSYSTELSPLPCGNTPSEALEHGCHFDLIATAWLPPKCIDSELVDEFQAEYQWQYFADNNGTERLSDDADTLGSYTGTIWTVNRWHVAHCLYMWRKLNRALVNGWMTDAETFQQHHTDHCTGTILKFRNPDGIQSIVEVIYPPC